MALFNYIIDFIKYRWSLPKKEIADSLHIEKSSLSKEYYGTREIRNKILYEFFDLTNEDSVAKSSREKETELLEAIKNFLKENGCEYDLEDIWEEKYESFIKKLFEKSGKKLSKDKNKNKKDNIVEETSEKHQILIYVSENLSGR